MLYIYIFVLFFISRIFRLSLKHPILMYIMEFTYHYNKLNFFTCRMQPQMPMPMPTGQPPVAG